MTGRWLIVMLTLYVGAFVLMAWRIADPFDALCIGVAIGGCAGMDAGRYLLKLTRENHEMELLALRHEHMRHQLANVIGRIKKVAPKEPK